VYVKLCHGKLEGASNLSIDDAIIDNDADERDDDAMQLTVEPEHIAAATREERYFQLMVVALRACAQYKPMFGKGRKGGLTVEQFQALYGADPFYHWVGLDSPLMYAAHKAAGGMTSIYRQLGIGGEWILGTFCAIVWASPMSKHDGHIKFPLLKVSNGHLC
jgi:hypothetical protein